MRNRRNYTELDTFDSIVSDLMTACLRFYRGGRRTHSSIFTVGDLRRTFFVGSQKSTLDGVINRGFLYLFEG